MNSLVRRFVPLGAVLYLAILLLPGVAFSAEKLHGWGIVMSRSLAESTLEIDGRHYRVTRDTRFTALDGRPLDFASLPIFDVRQGLFAVADATKVEFRGQRADDGTLLLDEVQVVKRLPD